jgi:hypothetical protein
MLSLHHLLRTPYWPLHSLLRILRHPFRRTRFLLFHQLPPHMRHLNKRRHRRHLHTSPKPL